ncbi:MAG TPA: lamin tail domain-containing protein, partial [Planctomycetota bacterium]|nr:lamin tail domain-containing protein [Planctomycetota bacterium]
MRIRLLSELVLGVALTLGLVATSPVLAAPWLTFTEVSYHPRDEKLEFVEIHHLDAPGIDLGGWRLAGEITFEFPRGTRLEPHETIVIARDLEAFRAKHPTVTKVVGPFEGRLDNKGGRIELRHRAGGLIAEMEYGRDGAWSSVADGTGHTLVLADGSFDPLAPESWIPSARPGGSPGIFEATLRS